MGETLVFFSFLAAIILVPPFLRYRERQRLMETVKLAYERGQPVPPELIESVITRAPARPPSAQRDLRAGLILVAIALGFVGFGAALGYAADEDAVWPLVGIAAFPGFIGLTLIGLWFFNRRGPVA